MKNRQGNATRRLAAATIATLLWGAAACSDENTAPTSPSPVTAESTRGAVIDNGIYAPGGTSAETTAIGAGTRTSGVPEAVETVETPTAASTGLDRATLPPGMTAQAALGELQSTLAQNQRSATRRTKPSKPEFTSVDVSAESVATAWTESTPPAGDSIESYELKFQGLAGTGTDATYTLTSLTRSTTKDVDAGYYWVFIRAKGVNSGYCNSDFEFIEVPEEEPDTEPDPPKPPQVSLSIGADGWNCETDRYCTLAIDGTARRDSDAPGLKVEWIIRPGSEQGSWRGTPSTLFYVNQWKVPVGGTVRFRAAQERADVWSDWSSYANRTATPEEAASDSASSVPGALSNLRVTEESGGYRVSFTRGSHGGLPITRYEWGPTSAADGCNEPGFPYQSLQALNDNLEQSFLVYGYGKNLSMRARNAKGAGPCADVPFPGRPPEFSVSDPTWTCSGNEYCFKTVIVTVIETTTYQVEIEERTDPNSTRDTWTREILEEGGVQRFIQIGDWWWMHARQRADQNSPWSDWSETLEFEAPITEAVASSPSSEPGVVSDLTATRYTPDQVRIQFRRGSHGGLPITEYEWLYGPTATTCPSLGTWSSLTPPDDDFEQSFLLNVSGTGNAISVRPVNAKGTGACRAQEVSE